MKDGIAELVMTGARDLAEIFDEGVAIAGDETWNGLLMQPREQIAIAGEIAAIEQRDREFNVVRVEALAFGEAASSRAELQAQIPKFLRKAADGIFKLDFSRRRLACRKSKSISE